MPLNMTNSPPLNQTIALASIVKLKFFFDSKHPNNQPLPLLVLLES
jgi:hypothetical protein